MTKILNSWICCAEKRCFTFERYMRNHMDLNILEEQQRFPREE